MVFENISDRNEILERKSALRFYENEHKQGIFLNEYLPQSVNEKRRRERDITSIVKETTNEPVEYTKTGLKIGKTVYRKKVVAPAPTDLLDLSPEELNQILEMKINRGAPMRVEDSVFIAYSADVDNHQSIRRLYLKVRLQQARARHVVCAYSLPGNDKIHNEDFEDDDEPGAGRTLLQVMQENDIQKKVFFVVRHCGKVKLGKKRLPSYLLAATANLKQFPMNNLEKKKQTFDNWAYKEKYLKEKKDRKQKNATRGADGDVEPVPNKQPKRVYATRAFDKERTRKKITDTWDLGSQCFSTLSLLTTLSIGNMDCKLQHTFRIHALTAGVTFYPPC